MAVCVPKFSHLDAFVKTRADRRAVDEGCTFDQARGQRVVRFIEKYLIPTRGFGADKPAKLLDWQREDFVLPLFSWIRPDGTRRFREAAGFIPRQNGKSFLAAAVATFMLVADGEAGPDVLLLGVNAEQTTIVFNEVANSVQSSPELSAALVVKPSTKEITYPKANGRLKGLSREGRGKLGRPPHCSIMDEFAFWYDYEPYTALTSGTGSRKQPLTLCISTSGTDRSTPAFEMFQYAKGIIDGGNTDPAFFPLVYAADPGDDIHAPATWAKCNPSIGHTIPESYFREKSDKARVSKVEELTFRQFYLNEWVTSTSQWLNLDAWHRCKVASFPDMKGMPAYVGVDLSTTTDMTSVVAVIPHAGRFYVDAKSFCCRKGVERREANNLVRYSVFEQEGTLEVHDGDAIDYHTVKDYIRSLCRRYKVKAVAFDYSHNAADMAQQLQAERLPVTEFGSGPKFFNMPMKRLSELVLGGQLAHKGDSLINWQAANLEAKRDHEDKVKPTKPSPDSKIDTMVSLLMALSKALEGQATAAAKTNYAGRALRVL